ncbi:MAG TPA: hypothetical protein PK733_01595 [Clostridiales bacterium]|nr:hypothetical protein [Clostridiales bacterium]
MQGNCKNIELSDRDWNYIILRPGRLLCLKCLSGGGCLPFMEKEKLKGKLDAIKDDPQIHIRLETSFDEIGARTTRFFQQSVAERKRDLDVLQKLGLSPGDVRIARDLYVLIGERIKDVYDICGYGGSNSEKWPACPLAHEEYFSKGTEGMNKLKDKDKMSSWKKISCDEIEQANRIVIRAHHLLCLFCYIARDDFGGEYVPLAEDNLYEVWIKMRENLDIPVTVIEGPGDCMICPPCHGFDNERKICFVACHLRDRKKDTDTLQKLDLLPGETIPANEVIKRVYEKIPDNSWICAYEYESAPQWRSCGGHERYKIGLERGFFVSKE